MNKRSECVSQKLGRSTCIETDDTSAYHSSTNSDGELIQMNAEAKQTKTMISLVICLTLSYKILWDYWIHSTKSGFVQAEFVSW